MTDTLPPWALEKAREWLHKSCYTGKAASLTELTRQTRISLAALLVEVVGDRVVSLVTERDEAEAKLAEARAELMRVAGVMGSPKDIGRPSEALSYVLASYRSRTKETEARYADLVNSHLQLGKEWDTAEVREAKLRADARAACPNPCACGSGRWPCHVDGDAACEIVLALAASPEPLIEDHMFVPCRARYEKDAKVSTGCHFILSDGHSCSQPRERHQFQIRAAAFPEPPPPEGKP